jgi:hypothetical protein
MLTIDYMNELSGSISIFMDADVVAFLKLNGKLLP